MYLALIIWSACTVLFVIIGISSRRSEKPAGFWANAKPPEVDDVKSYNKAVSRLWFVFAALFELAGLPLLKCRQNSLIILVSVMGTVFIIIGIMIAYTRIEAKYRK